MKNNTGYKQARYATATDPISGDPLDKHGVLCSVSGFKQAILLLKETQNPDVSKYEVIGSFVEGQKLDSYDTSVYDILTCPLPKPEVPQMPSLPDYPIQTGFFRFDNLSGWPNYWYHQAKDWDFPYNSDEWNMKNVPNALNQQTVQYVRIGEYEWMRQSPSFYYNNRAVPNPNITDYMLSGDVQDTFMVKETAADFMYKTGAFVYGIPDISTFLTYGQMYDSRDMTKIIGGWKPAGLMEYAQLMVQSEDLNWMSVFRFLCAKRDNPNDIMHANHSGGTVISDIRHVLDDDIHGTDDVKFHLIPAGKKQNENNNMWIDYRQGAYLKVGMAEGNWLQFKMSASGVYMGGDAKFWWGQQRYCRALEDSELGYRLYKDVANDKIVVVDYGANQPTDLPELPKGRLRGRAVRWMNPQKTKVLAPLSLLEKEIAVTKEGGLARWFGFGDI